MQRHLVDGVPVLHTGSPGLLTAGLVFEVGRRDETFLGGGITHLVEHLSMSTLGRSTLDCNATVGVTTTRWTRWERERPAAYRLASGAVAALQAALAAAAADRADGDWTSGSGVLAVVLGLSALGSLWSTRPPSR